MNVDECVQRYSPSGCYLSKAVYGIRWLRCPLTSAKPSSSSSSHLTPWNKKLDIIILPKGFMPCVKWTAISTLYRPAGKCQKLQSVWIGREDSELRWSKCSQNHGIIERFHSRDLMLCKCKCKYHIIHSPQGLSGIIYNTGWGTLPDCLSCT